MSSLTRSPHIPCRPSLQAASNNQYRSSQGTCSSDCSRPGPNHRSARTSECSLTSSVSRISCLKEPRMSSLTRSPHIPCRPSLQAASNNQYLRQQGTCSSDCSRPGPYHPSAPSSECSLTSSVSRISCL